MAILAQLTFRISRNAGATAGTSFDAGQYPTGGGIGTGGGSGYTPDGGPFFPPNVASPYFVPTPVYGPTPGPAATNPVLIVSKDPQGTILAVEHPRTAIPGSSFNLITRFTHKHSGSGVYAIRVKFPQIGIDSVSPPTTVSQNGVSAIISTITVPGDSATTPVPAVLTGTVELIRTQPAGTYPTGTTTEAQQVIDDSRTVTITRIGTVPIPLPTPTPVPTPTPTPVPTPGCSQFGISCHQECEYGYKKNDPLCIACLNCFGNNPHKMCRPSSGRNYWNGTQCDYPPGPIPTPTPIPPGPTPIPGPAVLTIVPQSTSSTYVNILINGSGFHANEKVVLSYFISARTNNQFLFVSELQAGSGGVFSKPIAIKKVEPIKPQEVRFRAQGKTSLRQAETKFSPLI